MRKLPTQVHLQEWFDYDPETGIFVWRKEPCQIGSMLGNIAGSIRENGYVTLSVPGFGQYRAHLMAWIYVHGLTIGGAEIDHEDTNPSNNAIGNLRLATPTQQQQNRKVQSNNRSGLKGAYYHACHKGKKWRSQIKIDENGVKRLIFLGYFHTAQEAHEAYGRAALTYFGNFARTA